MFFFDLCSQETRGTKKIEKKHKNINNTFQHHHKLLVMDDQADCQTHKDLQ